MGGMRHLGTLGPAVLAVTLGSGMLAFGVINRQNARAAGLPAATPSASTVVSPALTTMASPAPRPSRTTPAKALGSAVDATYARLAAYLSGRGRRACLGIVDLRTGAQVLYNANLQFETASIVKVDILATLLWQAQNAKHQLSGRQRTLATAMITQSDNDATSALWAQIGMGRGLTAANRAFGLTHTAAGTGGSWGLTRTTATDQLRLLSVLSTAGPLGEQGRKYLLGLMGSVTSGQRWGVPHAAGSDATEVYVKNGWLPRSADGYLWIINTIGRIVAPGHDWLVVVLSNDNAGMGSGVSLVERASDLAVDGLGGG